jgi:hypothetical protein
LSLKVACTLFVNACATYHTFPLDCGAAKQNNGLATVVNSTGAFHGSD